MPNVKSAPVCRQLSGYGKLCLMALFMMWPGFAVLSRAQTGKEPSNQIHAASPPENYLSDQANIFHEHPAALEAIVDSLTRLDNDHAYPVYLVLYYNVLDASLRERADELYEKWIGQSGRGMVIVYQLDPVVYGDNPAMAYHKGDGLELRSEAGAVLIPESDIAAILARIQPEFQRKANIHNELSSWIVALEREIDHYLNVKPASWKDAENVMLIAVFAGFVITIPLVGILIHRLLLASSNELGKTYYFPEVHVAYRLGAPYGGGWTSERTFTPSQSQS